MAEEGPVENLMSRYFCHKCKVEISDILPDYECPTCHCGFIEILDAPPEANEESDSSDVEAGQPFEMLNYVLMGLNGGGLEDILSNRREHRRSGRSGRNRQMAPVENLLQDFIVNLAGGGWGGQLRNAAGTTNVTNGPVLFLGNPGDYAWGRDGLDAIVTQLLNQMDGTGPPPLAKDKIQEIPIVIITQDQVDSSLQCSVCWEDFKIDEPVRKLSCEHVYHSPCIIPWLELHGTCPICRKTLNDGDSNEETNNASGSVNTVLSPFATFFRNADPVAGNRLFNSNNLSQSSNSSTASNSSSSSTTSSSSSSSSRGQDYMDYEFND
ncbi:E3 ubiquitin-protein ligase Iruka [Lycorma delicatula]|uniref:E3 ubiquitin-protein ligase Iruka n=1 Tax=Lycorma delicatula TaxID=130591 RepID=UPI003F510360